MTRNFTGEQTTQDVKDEIITNAQGREDSLGSHLTVPSDQLFVASIRVGPAATTVGSLNTSSETKSSYHFHGVTPFATF